MRLIMVLEDSHALLEDALFEDATCSALEACAKESGMWLSGPLFFCMAAREQQHASSKGGGVEGWHIHHSSLIDTIHCALSASQNSILVRAFRNLQEEGKKTRQPHNGTIEI